MGQNNYHSRWQPRLPRVAAAPAPAPARSPSPGVNKLDRVLPALHLHLAPVFASSFSRSASVKSMAAYGNRPRGPLSFSVFRDDHDHPGEEEAQSHAKLQKRLPRDEPVRDRTALTLTRTRAKPSASPSLPQPAAVSSTTDGDHGDLSRPLANPGLPRLPEARRSSREPPASQCLARRSLQPLTIHLGRPGASDLAVASSPRSAHRHARSASASTDGAVTHRLSSVREPAATLSPRCAPAPFSQLWSTPSSPELSPVTCQRASHRASGFDDFAVDRCRLPRRSCAANTSSANPAEQQSLSDHSDTLTPHTSSNQHSASDSTDITLTDNLTDPSSAPTRNKIFSRSKRTAKQHQQMDPPDSSNGDGSATNLLTKVSGILGEKSTNLKRSLPFLSTPPKPAEKLSIGAPFNVRQGPGAMSAPARRPRDGEDTRTWGAPDRVDKKPVIPQAGQQTMASDGSNAGEECADSLVQGTKKSSEDEQTDSSAVHRQSPVRRSPSLTALPTPPPAPAGLRGWMASAHRLSRLALTDTLQPTGGSDNESCDGSGQQQQDGDRPNKASIFERMKHTLRRHKRRNTAVQTAVDLRDAGVQTNFRASRSVAMLTSPLTMRSTRHVEISPPLTPAATTRTPIPELPPINSGPAISVSSMSLLKGPHTDGHAAADPASKSPRVERANKDLPDFAKEPSMPEGIEVAGHNGFYRMGPLGSHTNVMDFIEVPSAANSTRMAAIPEDRAESLAGESSAVRRKSSEGADSEDGEGEASMSPLKAELASPSKSSNSP